MASLASWAPFQLSGRFTPIRNAPEVTRNLASFWHVVPVEKNQQRCTVVQERGKMSEEQVRTEEFQVSGDALVAKIKELVHEGNIRHVAIKNEDGRTLVDIPLTLGVVGTLLAPQLAAIGAIAALVTRCTIAVERVEEPGE